MTAVIIADSHVNISRVSKRKIIKKRYLDEEVEDVVSKKYRHCGKSGCTAAVPICFLSITEKCSGNGYTSRWYHMSPGEHFCNECYDFIYRSHKGGYQNFISWKKAWSAEGTSDPNIACYVADQLMPYWVLCTNTSCGKWRQLPKDSELTPEFINKFTCQMAGQKKDYTACSVTEDLRVTEAQDFYWMEYLAQMPLLKYSPAAQYLHHFYPEGIGLSPTSSSSYYEAEINPWLKPFSQQYAEKSCLSLSPGFINPEEAKELPECTKYHRIYLGIRNMILALWSSSPKEWLTIQKVNMHLICRGLVRIRLVSEAKKILNFLTKQGIVNYGILHSPKEYSLFPQKRKEIVLVIGAGVSGLSAAKHLHNMGIEDVVLVMGAGVSILSTAKHLHNMAIEVSVLEARSRIGGCVWDQNSSEHCIGRGAQIIHGVINNPLTILCEQAEVKMKLLKERIVLLNHKGMVIDNHLANRMQFHFNAILDSAEEWKREHSEDISFLDKVMELHQSFKIETGINFTQEEEDVFHFYFNSFEWGTGTIMKHASALSWDQSGNFSQNADPDIFLPRGYSALIEKLAEGLNIHLDCKVLSVNYINEEVIVVTNKGDFKASKVLVTVPLPVLRKEAMTFHPPLPESKIAAFQQLGDGVIEKVILHFPKQFWKGLVKNSDSFGYIPCSEDKCGLFQVFSDVTNIAKNEFSLISYLSDSSLVLLEGKNDEEIVKMCMDNLRKIFMKVPEPTAWFVTKWSQDSLAGSSGSFVKIGGSGDAHDELAKEVNHRVYFAGEATYRQFAHSVTGAYLSGIREASKIMNHLIQITTVET